MHDSNPLPQALFHGTSQGDDPQVGEWLADLERLGGVGSWRMDSQGRLWLSPKAQELLEPALGSLDHVDLVRLLARVRDEGRASFAAWWGGRAEPSEPVASLGTWAAELVQPDGRPLRLSFVRHGGRRDLGFLCPGAKADDLGGGSFELDLATGLPGREHFLALLARAMPRAASRNHRLGLLALCARPQEGADDRVRGALLSECSHRLRQCLRDVDVVTRIAGDPQDVAVASSGHDLFLVAVELKRPHDASNVGRRLMEVLSRPLEWNGETHTMRCNGGIALHPEDSLVPEQLLQGALLALERAQQEGLGALHYHCNSLNAAAIEKESLEARLLRAVENQELELYYQPKVEIATERITSFEALVRWRHPELGLVSPAQFIPLAEETGAIIPIGRWVLEQACRDTKMWQTSGLPPVRMAVNLSSVQFREPQLFDWVMQALEQTKLDPKWLELELTESMLMHDVDATAAILRRLKAKGIHIAIDDFGTGYSSLSYLRRFPIDALKIDRSFIREINTNPDDAAISTSIILMGRSLKLRVIAEGVETRSQLAFLRVMQCDEAQGYLFSQPVPEPRARALLEAQARRTSGYGASTDAA